MSFVLASSKDCCSAPKSGTPFSPGTTISPSYHPDGSVNRASSFCSGRSFSVQSLPLRVNSLMSAPSMRVSRRYPSNLISYTHSSGSAGGEAASVASCGANFSGSAALTAPSGNFRTDSFDGVDDFFSALPVPRSAGAFVAFAMAMCSPLTLLGCSSTTLNSAAGRTNASFSLMSSHGSCRSLLPFMRTSAQRPCNL